MQLCTAFATDDSMTDVLLPALCLSITLCGLYTRCMQIVFYTTLGCMTGQMVHEMDYQESMAPKAQAIVR